MIQLIALEWKKNRVGRYALGAVILTALLALFLFAQCYLGIANDPVTGVPTRRRAPSTSPPRWTGNGCYAFDLRRHHAGRVRHLGLPQAHHGADVHLSRAAPQAAGGPDSGGVDLLHSRRDTGKAVFVCSALCRRAVYDAGFPSGITPWRAAQCICRSSFPR